jgi:hypothetical protein
MALRLPRGAEREYSAIYGIVAVYVAALRDLLHTELAPARRWFGTQLTCAYWVKDETEARLIMRQSTTNSRMATACW